MIDLLWVGKNFDPDYCKWKKKKDKKREYDFEPESADVEFQTFKEPDSRQWKSTVKMMSKVLAFIDLNKGRRFKDKVTVMPVPTTNKQLISIFGSPMEVSRGIRYMIERGLLSVYDDSYQFGAYYSKDNKSKLYCYYPNVEKDIIKYCDSSYIPMYVVSNVVDIVSIVNKVDLPTFERYQVRFCKDRDVHFLKPENMSHSEFELYLLGCLHENYPDLKIFQELADSINEKYYKDYPELAIRYKPSFEWTKDGKAVQKIGIRYTNSLCNLKKEIRSNYISDRYGINLYKDVKSSVPRVTRSLHDGKWVNESIDIYQLIFNCYVSKLVSIVNKVDFSEYREAIKALHMEAYFDDFNNLGKDTISHIKKDLSEKESNYVRSIMIDFKESLDEVEGESYGSDIFYHESNIYLLVLEKLLSMNYFTWVCYDAFYSSGNLSQLEYELFVTQLIENIANEYIDGVK